MCSLLTRRLTISQVLYLRDGLSTTADPRGTYEIATERMLDTIVTFLPVGWSSLHIGEGCKSNSPAFRQVQHGT